MEFMEVRDIVAEDLKLKSATNNRKIIFWEEVTEQTCLKLQYMIENIVNEDYDSEVLPKDAEPITIAISSYGGSLLDIFSVIGYIENLKDMGYQIITIAEGKAMSAGAFLLMCGSKRYARKYASVMFHQLSAGCHGTISEMENQVREFRRLWDLLKQLTVENTNMTEEDVDRIFNTNQDYYYSPHQCLEMGIIDQIL